MSTVDHNLGDLTPTMSPDFTEVATERLHERHALDLVPMLGLDGRPGRCTHKHSDKRVCHLDGGHGGDHEFGGVWR